MKNKMKKFLSMVLSIAMFIAACPCALAMENPSAAAPSEEAHALFSGVSQLAPGESMQYEVHSETGMATVGIELVSGRSRAEGRIWRVWYNGLNTDVEFYMTVSNNKVTSVYDYSISLVGSSYEDAVLSKTTTYGKLTFTHKSILGLSASTCWLKGTVTGEDDDIDVSWQM